MKLSVPPSAEEAAGDAPPDAGLLADAVEALEAGRLPLEHALEELCHLARQRSRVKVELRRRAAVRECSTIATENPGASRQWVAATAARRLGESAETVRQWARMVGGGGGDS